MLGDHYTRNNNYCFVKDMSQIKLKKIEKYTALALKLSKFTVDSFNKYKIKPDNNKKTMAAYMDVLNPLSGGFDLGFLESKIDDESTAW